MSSAPSSPLIEAVSTTGTVLAFLMFMAQMPSMYVVIFKTKSVERLSILPTIGQSLNFLSWVFYTLANGDGNVFRVNAIGCGFAAFYLGVFLVYTRGKEAWTRLLTLLGASVLVFGGLWAGISLGVADLDARISGLGAVAVACNVAMYGAPIRAIVTAYRDLDPDLIPLLLTCVNTATSACWLVYGLLVGPNWFLAGPNVAGTILCLMQLAVAMYVNIRVMRDPELSEKRRRAKAAAAAGGEAGGKGVSFAGEDELLGGESDKMGLLINGE
jgi:uncharacterized protein with PQ loop repeat